jgi:hypothetical protein
MQSIPAGEEPASRRPQLKRGYPDGGRGEIYPYDDWANGTWLKATRGVDFDVAPASFRAALARWARANGRVALISRVEGNVVSFKLGPLTEEQKLMRSYYLTPEEFAKRVEARKRPGGYR